MASDTSPSLRDVEFGEDVGEDEEETIESRDIEDSRACDARSEEERFREIVDLTSFARTIGGGLLDDSSISGSITVSIGKKQSFSSSSKNDAGGRGLKVSKNMESEAENDEGWKTRGGRFACSASSGFPSRRSQGRESPKSFACAILARMSKRMSSIRGFQ